MRDTSIIHLTPQWQHSLRTVHRGVKQPDGLLHYVPARPEGFASIRHRIEAAWLVFTGRADALVWPEGQ